MINQAKIISQLRGSQSERQEAIRALCTNSEFKGSLQSFIFKNSGEEDDVKMMLTDTIVSFAKQVFTNKDFELKGDLNGYLFGIARFKWLDELKKKKQKAPFTQELEEYHTQPEESHMTQLLKGEKAQVLQQVLAVMRSRCKEVLMYWAGNYSMKEIATLVGYQSEGMARKKKSECMKELLMYLSNNPKIKEELRS